MISRRAHERIIAQYQREINQLLQIIREQNDRIMYLADKSWTLPPRPVEPDPAWNENENEDEDFVLAAGEQLPD